MKYIETFTKQEESKKEITYNKLGSVSEDKEKVFAKHARIPLSGGGEQKKFYITVHNNVPYDPYGVDSHREDNLKISLKSVSEQTFDYYILYLKTRNSLYMTRANRSFING